MIEPIVQVVTSRRQPHEVRLANGAKINWLKPPRRTTKCRWTKRATNGKVVCGSFRTIAHLNRLNNLALAKYGVGIEVIQPPFNTGVKASAGTHDYDACYDLHIPGVSWWEQQRFFRANGAGGWYRPTTPGLWNNHIHAFTLPPREGKSIGDDFAVAGFKVGLYVDGGISLHGKTSASSQLVDYYNHAFGLAGKHGKNSDTSWFPKDIEATVFDLAPYIKKRADSVRKQMAA